MTRSRHAVAWGVALALSASLVVVRLYPGVPAGTGARYNVVLVSLDTLAADHLDLYGYHRRTAPFLTQLASQGANFQQAFANASWTLPSHMSMLTGTFPESHRMDDDPAPAALDPGIRTLPELLAGAGYKTAWFGPIDDVTLPMSERFGRGIGEIQPPGLYASSMRQLVSWFERNRSATFYAFIHTYSVHDPYLPPKAYDVFDPGYRGGILSDPEAFVARLSRSRHGAPLALADVKIHAGIGRPLYWGHVDKRQPRDVEHLRALYDAEILHLDGLLRRLFEEFRRLGLMARTLFVVTSDHGEAFGEHGHFLHESLHGEVLHVPLLILRPGLKPTEIRTPVQSVDILPTILEVLGLPVPDRVEGRSLVPLMRGETQEHTEYLHARFKFGTAIRSAAWKLIMNPDNSLELYDVASDPHETKNLSLSRPDVAERLRREDSMLTGGLRGRGRHAP